MLNDECPGDNSIEYTIKAIICAHLLCDFDEIHQTSRFVEDLYADSLDILDMFLQVREQLNLELDTDKLSQTRTVGAFCQLVDQSLRENTKNLLS
ncbi:phosphopantetheine-binding protein [Pseudomonas fluorescens]|uniref:Acyl carrier protein n=1 Tax=Pseudomonas fluorescens TaxID=294 RepID=A0A5E7GAN6_PSEFL|nr:phosphopantetheine-binding protein [Pseudomonas fluorescens]VVO48615.1 Acyl carrier protein [Pseudomonas fluorescens]